MSENQSFSDSVRAKAQQVAREDYDQAKALIQDAARSRAYLYPIKGIVYFFSHRSLWQPLLSRLAPTLALSAGVVASMFFLFYVPQLAVLVFVNGPLAVFTTVVLVLNESSTVVSMLSRGWLLHDALLDTFDGTLLARGATGVVGEGREIKTGERDPVRKLGRVLKQPFERFSPKAIIRHLMYLPLNFIPVVGTAAFILVNGRSRGHSVHSRYFQLKGWSSAQRTAWLQEHAGAYTAFGTAATLLEMIPFASVLFTFTNTVGAALWAADIEAKGTETTDTTAPDLREAARKAE